MKYFAALLILLAGLTTGSSTSYCQETKGPAGAVDQKSETEKRAKELIEKMKKAKEAGAQPGQAVLRSGKPKGQVLPEGAVDQKSETEKRAKELIEKMKKAKEPGPEADQAGLGNGEPEGQILPEVSDIAMLDPPTKEQYFAALREYYSYRISGFQHRRQVFEWQLFSSRIIFVVVIILVLSGIYFSGVQFHSSLRRKRAEPSVEADAVTEIEASFKGIKVSSSILGVIILIISFLFFYLYLVHVYPINNVL